MIRVTIVPTRISLPSVSNCETVTLELGEHPTVGFTLIVNDETPFGIFTRPAYESAFELTVNDAPVRRFAVISPVPCGYNFVLSPTTSVCPVFTPDVIRLNGTPFTSGMIAEREMT